MWEWRIYYERDFLSQLPDFLDFKEQQSEKRSDYYYDFGKPQYGLKERLSYSEDINPKIELKIRYDVSDFGAEYWHKVISEEYQNSDNSSLKMYQVEDIITKNIEDDQEYSSDIEYFHNNLPSGFQKTKVEKERWEIETEFSGEEVDFEYVHLKIDGEELFGFSIECEDLRVIKQIIEEFQIDSYQLKGGYPSLIRAINSILISTPFIEN